MFKKIAEAAVRKCNWLWIPNVCKFDTYAVTTDGKELHAKAVCVIKAKRWFTKNEKDHLMWKMVKTIKQETELHSIEETKKNNFCDRFALMAGVYASDILKANGSCRMNMTLQPNC